MKCPACNGDGIAIHGDHQLGVFFHPCIHCFGYGAACDCEFDPYDDGDTEESYHYKRTCESCGNTWFGLHCPHDGIQNPCPKCGNRPEPRTA